MFSGFMSYTGYGKWVRIPHRIAAVLTEQLFNIPLNWFREGEENRYDV